MVDIVIFDLGRVLIDVDVERCLTQFSEAFQAPVHEILNGKGDGAHTDFMVGKLTGDEFHRLTCQRFGRNVDAETFRNVWLSMLGEPKHDSIAVVAELLNRKFPLAVLSNVDPWHFSHCKTIIPEIQQIENIFLSYEIKLKKPDPAIFTHVLNALEIPAEKCLFVDDLVENVEAATKIGIRTIHFKEAGQLVEELKDHGISI